jgi:hypothetical protein
MTDQEDERSIERRERYASALPLIAFSWQRQRPMNTLGPSSERWPQNVKLAEKSDE